MELTIFLILIQMVLVSSGCSDNENTDELMGLTEIAYRYLDSSGIETRVNGYCMSPEIFEDYYEDGFFSDDIKIFMYDLEYWNPSVYDMFGYDPPSNFELAGGEIIFNEKLVLMMYSLGDDFNSPILTHELMHFILWKQGFPKDVFYDQVHEDWREYKMIYEEREKLWSNLLQKYYYIFWINLKVI